MTVLDATEHSAKSLDAELGAEAARLIWDDAPEAGAIRDPRTPEFARAMIDTSVSILRSSRGLIKKMIDRAAAGAEDLAVAKFQGIIEVIQNADDVRAMEVRFALKDAPDGQQLLIVHNGEPVTCHNVLGMALPYLTTKTERTDQRGRFGIGLKTVKRIANSIAIHSAPYHFSGDQLRFDWIEPEPAIPCFYDPATDTLLVLGLNDAFDEGELKEWFDAWQDDGLLFLASVSRFRWCELDGTTRSERAVAFTSWADAGYGQLHPGVLELKVRRVDGPADHWTVWRATVSVPPHLHPAHKARSETTEFSIALADGDTRPGLFIGFRSQVPLTLPFSLDAQFDPSTSREAIIENPWNNWLIDRVAEVVADIAGGLLATTPRAGWTLVPLESENVGKDDDPWVRGRFASAFAAARRWLKEVAVLALSDAKPALAEVAYEDEALSGLLDEDDVERIASEERAVQSGIRDAPGRWRNVLDTLDISTVIGTDELLEALGGGLFADKAPEWWVEAGARLVAYYPDHKLFGKAFLLSDEHAAVACHAIDDTEKPLVFDVAPSAFAARWKLLERLHPAYGADDSGKEVIEWLTANAAFTSHLDAEIEVAAFAEHFDGTIIEMTDEELRDLRARFDGVSERRAEELGLKVGAVLLLDGHVFKAGKPIRQKVVVSEAYLCKTLDAENSTWPDAVGTTPGIPWIAAKYEKVLKTDVGRWAKRKRDDGSVSRGPRRFLTLLGAEIAPRIEQTKDRVRWGTETRVAELRQRGAEQVKYDLLSPDLSRVIKNLQNLNKRDAKLRSPALLRTFARNWDRIYAEQQTVPAEHVATKYTYPRGEVTAGWLNELRDTPWIAVGRGELVEPQFAVLRTPETQTLYQTFACEVAREDVHDGLAAALHLITDVRIGDVVSRLEELRDGDEEADDVQVLQIYRIIAKRCPHVAAYNTRIGEMTVQELRRRFLDGDGLVYVGGGVWRRSDQVMRGMDIFHDLRVFVPGGAACANLWKVLDVAEPDVDNCIRFCRELAQESYGPEAEAALMDVYRYMERLVGAAERKHREKLRRLPLSCGGEWVTTRPVYYVDSAELRGELVGAVASLKCWTPPCDVRDFPRLAELMAVDSLEPELTVQQGRNDAIERGEYTRLRFGHAVDHLSAELARSEPATRDRIAVSWDQLKAVPLLVYHDAIAVRASSPSLPAGGVTVSLKALAREQPREFHLRDDDRATASSGAGRSRLCSRRM